MLFWLSDCLGVYLVLRSQTCTSRYAEIRTFLNHLDPNSSLRLPLCSRSSAVCVFTIDSTTLAATQASVLYSLAMRIALPLVRPHPTTPATKGLPQWGSLSISPVRSARRLRPSPPALQRQTFRPVAASLQCYPGHTPGVGSFCETVNMEKSRHKIGLIRRMRLEVFAKWHGSPSLVGKWEWEWLGDWRRWGDKGGWKPG